MLESTFPDSDMATCCNEITAKYNAMDKDVIANNVKDILGQNQLFLKDVGVSNEKEMQFRVTNVPRAIIILRK